MLTPKDKQVDVVVQTSDENGQQISHPVGSYAAPCTVMVTAPNGDITAVKCCQRHARRARRRDDVVVVSRRPGG